MVGLLLLVFLSLLLNVCFLQALLGQLLAPVSMVGKVLVAEIKGRLRRGNNVVCDFLGGLGQVETRLVSFGFLSEIGMIVCASIVVADIDWELRALRYRGNGKRISKARR